MALMEVNFFSKALMRPVTMNVILPVDKVFFGEETEEENKPFKTLYLLHGVMGNYTDWVTGTCIKRWAEEKKSGSSYAFRSKYVLYGSSECK